VFKLTQFFAAIAVHRRKRFACGVLDRDVGRGRLKNAYTELEVDSLKEFEKRDQWRATSLMSVVCKHGVFFLKSPYLRFQTHSRR